MYKCFFMTVIIQTAKTGLEVDSILVDAQEAQDAQYSKPGESEDDLGLDHSDLYTEHPLPKIDLEGFSPEPRGQFAVGRIPAGRFELGTLNGWMNKHRAKETCEEHVECGGFTFRGSIAEEIEYEMFFFKKVDYVEQNLKSFGWVYYEPETRIPERVDLQQSLDDTDATVLDRCCPSVSADEVEQLYKQAADHNWISRVDCSISKEKFLTEFTMRGVPAIIEKCTTDWAASNWTFASMLQYGKGETEWRLDYAVDDYGKTQVGGSEYLAGEDILEMIVSGNATIRIFDPLNRRTFKEWPEEDLENEKLSFLKDYSPPRPIHKDLLQEAGLLTDMQWIILSDKGTGTELHMDPHLSTAWNAVLSGYKWWVVLPAELHAKDYQCDPACSKASEVDRTMNTNDWYAHILPQLRNRTWYGKKIIEFIHGPGDTLYLPRNTPHAIVNLEENISVTENIFTPDALEDYVLRMMIESMHLGFYRDEEVLYRQLYYRILNKTQRRILRSMRDQVEFMIERSPQLCYDTKDDDDDGDDEDEDDDDDDESGEDDDVSSEEWD